jgi:citrate synthase
LIKLINMKNSSEPLYLDARQAAAELSVTPATLYAYVSRGLIRSEPDEGSRTRRYRADDVRALKNRRAPPGEARNASESEQPVLDSAISTLTQEELIYRGVSAAVLSRTATLEQTATLLWDATGADPFGPANLPAISPAMQAIFEATRTVSPLDRVIAVLALAAEADPRAYNRGADGRTLTGGRILRLVAAAVAGVQPGAQPIHRQIARAWTPNVPKAEDFIRRVLVLLAEHELNASTYAVRVAASTGVSLYDAVIAGLAALKGPLHGGAGLSAARFVDSVAEGDAAAQIRDRVVLGERIPGFGHLVYKGGDPRAIELLQALAASGVEPRFASEIPALVTEATGAAANIDYAVAVLARALSLPKGSEIALFAIARTAGWIAHAIEQQKTGRLIRPRARYVGPALRR